MNCLQNPPPLKINKVLYKDSPMPVHVRVEQRIVWNLLLELEKNGFVPYSVHDSDELTRTRNKKAVMELLFNLDDATLYLRHVKGKEEADGFAVTTTWIRFVFGNETEVISDWNAVSYHGFDKVMDKFNPEVYA